MVNITSFQNDLHVSAALGEHTFHYFFSPDSAELAEKAMQEDSKNPGIQVSQETRRAFLDRLTINMLKATTCDRPLTFPNDVHSPRRAIHL
ncbi:MAG: hypothetical protein HOO67_07955 [Candidatus Peribacteraceae bacterium]|nr:hypothetical protein [Candidatus Peribacteraceae bacterium]